MGRTALAVMLAICLIASPAILPLASAAPAAGTLWVEIHSPVDGDYVGSDVWVTWTGDDTAGAVNYYEVWWDEHFIDVGLNESLELKGLPDGRHVVTVRAHSGTGFADDSVVFFVDTSDPALTILFPSSGDALNTSDVTVRWSADDPSFIAYYEIMLDGLTPSVRLNRSAVEHTLHDLSNGAHSVTVRAVDGAGNSTVRTVPFSVDTTVPVLDIISPSNRSYSTDGNVMVTWTASDAGENIKHFEVYLNGGDPNNVTYDVHTFSFTSLRDGEYEVVVRAIDDANNTDQDIITFIVDTVPPTIEETLPGDGAPIGTDVTVRFSKPMDRNASFLSIAGVTGTMSWDDLDLIFDPDGLLTYGTTYTVNVVARDLTGRWANTTWTFTTTDMAFLNGTVLDASGNPMANVTVAIVGGPSVLTDETGAFRLEFHAGEQILTISRPGYVTQNVPISIAPGAERSMGVFKMASAELIPLMGWVVALVAIVAVLLIYFVSRRRQLRPPARRKKGKEASRSWKGLEELERRSRRDREPGDDLDDRERL